MNKMENLIIVDSEGYARLNDPAKFNLCYKGCEKHNPHFALNCGKRYFHYVACPTGRRLGEGGN